jgi:diacylglycerol kinase (ATP)
MKLAKLLHNTTAGEEDHEASDLLIEIKKSGFECSYSPTSKKELRKLESGFDFLVVAGGDGTVRKITGELIKRKHLENPWKIALLPLGTANNIARTLGLEGETISLINSWHASKLKGYDVGDVYYNEKEVGFFLESFGYGIFPKLMKESSKQKIDEASTSENKIASALRLLYKIICSYKPRFCRILADGKEHAGNFLMAEVMNAKSIGPNLTIAPDADPGDGKFEFVFIPEEQREALAIYVQNKIEGMEIPFKFPLIRAKELSLRWDGSNAHMDDQLVKLKKDKRVRIEPQRGLLQFMVPSV